MMRIFLSPHFDERKIEYTFENEIITATINGITDVFDFSDFPEKGYYESVETVLSVNPIINVFRNEGILSVEVWNYINEDATEEEKFTKWIEV